MIAIDSEVPNRNIGSEYISVKKYTVVRHSHMRSVIITECWMLESKGWSERK